MLQNRRRKRRGEIEITSTLIPVGIATTHSSFGKARSSVEQHMLFMHKVPVLPVADLVIFFLSCFKTDGWNL